jgi:hypothetical protein
MARSYHSERDGRKIWSDIAVTRGQRLVIMLGQKKAVAMAVKNTSGRRRWSKLRDWVAIF